MSHRYLYPWNRCHPCPSVIQITERSTFSAACGEAQAGYTAACSAPIRKTAQKRLFRRYRLWTPDERSSAS